MKFTMIIALSAFAFFQASAAPLACTPESTSVAPPPLATTPPATSSTATTGGVNQSLVPDFGVSPGVNPDGNGNCDGINGANGKPILIPCSCPPTREAFIASLNANVAAGHDVNNPSVGAAFPEDDSKNSQISRLQTLLSTLQNLNGPGVGCPAVSTTYSAQLKALTG